MPSPSILRWLLALLIWLATAAPSAALELTGAERAYLAATGPVRYCVDPDWEPFEIISGDGRHEGIAADLLRLVAARTGLVLELVPTRDWDDSIAASREGRCTLLSFLNQTPKRDEWLVFTEPLFTDSNVFITREEHPFIVDPAALSGESLVLPRGTSIEERIRRDYPNLRLVLVDSERTAIEQVSEKKAAMTLRSLIVAAYTIRKEGLFNLKIAGQLPNYANNLRVGVDKGQPLLRDILNKGIASITATERGEIINRHVSIQVHSRIDYSLTIKIALGLSAILAVVAYWGWRMRELNRELDRRSQTDTLTGLPNRTRLNLQFPIELARANRMGRPLSVIMIDVDHFKRINDEFGHLVGDKVLIAIADVVRRSVRTIDLPARWGGEELLVLCPETRLDQAFILAGRICQAVRAHPFCTGRRHSVSLGVAMVRPDEDIDSLLQRADQALYLAKSGGRDCVRSEADLISAAAGRPDSPQ
jgi:diguanylate cyclase (GGDEF)-like protein